MTRKKIKPRVRPRTIIEFVDNGRWKNPVAHVNKEIRVNGVPVLVLRDGVDVEIGPDGQAVTTVTLRLLPTEVHFVNRRTADRNRWIRRLRALVRR